MNKIKIRELENRSDNRGSSFCVPEDSLNFIDKVHNFHIATIKPDAIRGNHYHCHAKEYIIIVYDDSWTLAYDQGNGSGVKLKQFNGSGTIAVEIEEKITHAVKNTGKTDLTIVAFTDKILDTEKPDVVQNIIIE